MTTQPTPEEIRRATFRVAFRGYDTSEVGAFLERITAVVEDLAGQRDRMAARLGEYADRDLQKEFENLGREVTSVLEAARGAAETMRDRAAGDAARWRSEAIAEAEGLGKSARAEAEALRTDAWTTGTQLLEQVQAEVQRLGVGAQRDALAVLGEAEREAHRLTSTARREAEDLVRNARMEAEKLAAQARADHDEVIASAHRQAESAQERTRALEQRREELMTELESVRSALSSFETELEDRRQGLGLSEAPELPRQVVIADERGGQPRIETWEEGHTVRVIRPRRDDETVPESDLEDDLDLGEDLDPGDADPDVLADEVARIREERETVAEEAVSEPDALSEVAEEEPAATPEVVESDERPDEVFELFQRLRSPQPESRPPPEPVEEQSVEPTRPPIREEPKSTAEGDPFETRERLLLPVTNTALKAIKRVLTEAQNDALDQIRATGQWSPDADGLGAVFRTDLESLVADATEAGREAATELGVGGAIGEGSDPPDVESLAAELAHALEAALESAGEGTRERSAAASRVFRGWRTDEAERRVRWVAMSSYHGALRAALDAGERPWSWMAAGRQCPTCRAAAETLESVPPAHRDCTCTIVPV